MKVGNEKLGVHHIILLLLTFEIFYNKVRKSTFTKTILYRLKFMEFFVRIITIF